MGHVLSCGLDLISSGTGIHVNQDLQNRMETLQSLATKSNITDREKLHVKAVKEWAKGYDDTRSSFSIRKTWLNCTL